MVLLYIFEQLYGPKQYPRTDHVLSGRPPLPACKIEDKTTFKESFGMAVASSQMPDTPAGYMPCKSRLRSGKKQIQQWYDSPLTLNLHAQRICEAQNKINRSRDLLHASSETPCANSLPREDILKSTRPLSSPLFRHKTIHQLEYYPKTVRHTEWYGSQPQDFEQEGESRFFSVREKQ